MMRLYIIRHADPDYDNDSLTEAGRKEAEALARLMASQGLDKIYCSPMGRANDTARHTATLLHMDYEIENWTKELWPELALGESPWGGICANEIPGEFLRSRENHISYQNWYEYKYLRELNPKDIYDKLKQDSDSFLLRHGYERIGGRYRILQHNEQKIAVFCHCAFGLTWLAHLLEIPVTLVWSGFWIPPSSVTTILFDERSDQWAVPRCIGLGDVSHLYEARLPIQPRGIITNFY
jgi:probable phosphoglycerate mutase